MDELSISGRRGTFRIADTTKKSNSTNPKQFTTIVVLEDSTIISQLMEDGFANSTASLARHGITASTELSEGEVIVAETYFTEITLSQGKVSIA